MPRHQLLAQTHDVNLKIIIIKSKRHKKNLTSQCKVNQINLGSLHCNMSCYTHGGSERIEIPGIARKQAGMKNIDEKL